MTAPLPAVIVRTVVVLWLGWKVFRCRTIRTRVVGNGVPRTRGAKAGIGIVDNVLVERRLFAGESLESGFQGNSLRGSRAIQEHDSIGEITAIDRRRLLGEMHIVQPHIPRDISHP